MADRSLLKTIVDKAIEGAKECPHRVMGLTDPYCSLFPYLREKSIPRVKCDYQLGTITLAYRFRAYHRCSYEPHISDLERLEV